MSNNHILIHDSNSNQIKGINKHILKNIDSDMNILFSKFHGKLLSIVQKYKPKAAMISSSEYTQEFHDFIAEYHNKITIFLVVDTFINNDNLNKFLDNTKIKIIKNNKVPTQYSNLIVEYSNLYDDELFYDRKLERNNKTIALLSLDNKKNDILKAITYPNKKYPIVAINNPNFKSPINLGLSNYSDLSDIFNKYSKVIDIDKRFVLEAQASNIPSLEFEDTEESLVASLDNNKTLAPIENIKEYTYEFFVKQTLLPYIRNT